MGYDGPVLLRSKRSMKLAVRPARAAHLSDRAALRRRRPADLVAGERLSHRGRARRAEGAARPTRPVLAAGVVDQCHPGVDRGQPGQAGARPGSAARPRHGHLQAGRSQAEGTGPHRVTRRRLPDLATWPGTDSPVGPLPTTVQRRPVLANHECGPTVDRRRFSHIHNRKLRDSAPARPSGLRRRPAGQETLNVVTADLGHGP